MTSELDRLQKYSKTVAKSHKNFVEAITAERSAEGKLLAQAIDIIKDTLPAICSPVKREDKLFFEQNALHVLYEKPKRRVGIDLKIPLQEIGLVLWEDRTFALLSYTSEAGGRIAHVQPLSYEEVVGIYEVADIIHQLERVLNGHFCGQKDAKAALIKKRVEKLHAIYLLLEP